MMQFQNLDGRGRQNQNKGGKSKSKDDQRKQEYRIQKALALEINHIKEQYKQANTVEIKWNLLIKHGL